MRWPKKGVATILCAKFTLAFEGESFSEMTLVKARYQVDGRYGGLFPPDSEPFHEEMGNGVNYEYSTHTREALLTFKNHRFVYCDFRNTLTADGKTYSTARAPVHLWVPRRGAITQRS